MVAWDTSPASDIPIANTAAAVETTTASLMIAIQASRRSSTSAFIHLGSAANAVRYVVARMLSRNCLVRHTVARSAYCRCGDRRHSPARTAPSSARPQPTRSVPSRRPSRHRDRCLVRPRRALRPDPPRRRSDGGRHGPPARSPRTALVGATRFVRRRRGHRRGGGPRASRGVDARSFRRRRRADQQRRHRGSDGRRGRTARPVSHRDGDQRHGACGTCRSCRRRR